MVLQLGLVGQEADGGPQDETSTESVAVVIDGGISVRCTVKDKIISTRSECEEDCWHTFQNQMLQTNFSDKSFLL